MSTPAAEKIPAVAPDLPPRERILTAARELFYTHGIHAISVDQVAEAASSNKMTLYRHFKSKDELVAACMRECAREWEEEWQENAQEHPGDPRGQLQAWLHGCAECLADDRGCALANAAVELPQSEHPARRVIEESKRAHRDAIIGLCRAAGYAEPERLGDEIFMMMEGARICRQSVCGDNPAPRLMAMFDKLLASHPRA